MRVTSKSNKGILMGNHRSIIIALVQGKVLQLPVTETVPRTRMLYPLMCKRRGNLPTRVHGMHVQGSLYIKSPPVVDRLRLAFYLVFYLGTLNGTQG